MKMPSFLPLALGLACVAAAWQTAEPGWEYQFPRDHQVHENFKTEWWYFTGNLTAERGRRFGYELTFFRQGIRPPNERGGTTSRFVVDDLKFAHFTITDAQGRKFHFFQKTSRGSFNEAGFSRDDRIAWIESWGLRMKRDGSFHLLADGPGARLDLELVPEKPPVVHGKNGVSQKAAGADHASHYYSITRLRSAGRIALNEKAFSVRGESWFDHEWATNQLAPGQVGWNWVSAQLNDGSELMLYQMRLANGAADPASSGTFIRSDGRSIPLTNADFKMTPRDFWKSPATKAEYPVAWRIEVPKAQLDFTIEPVLHDQELVLPPLIYWEGAFDLAGRRAGRRIGGHGYLELTGYAGPLQELNR
jgi:predicted secreted hydrolase